MSAEEFRKQMAACHRWSDLMNLFNGYWHEINVTYEELCALRHEFLARAEQLSEDQTPICSHGAAVMPDEVAA